MKLSCILLVLFASLASAQTVEAPKISDAAHARIRDIQLQQKNVENQYLQMQQQLANLEKQFNGLTTQLNVEIDMAYKEMGVKREDWPMDLGTLKISKAEKPKPDAAPAKKP